MNNLLETETNYLKERYPFYQEERVNNIIDYYIKKSAQEEDSISKLSEMLNAKLLFVSHRKCCVKCCPKCTTAGNSLHAIDTIDMHNKLSQWFHISNIIEKWKNIISFRYHLSEYLEKNKDDVKLINFLKSNYSEVLKDELDIVVDYVGTKVASSVEKAYKDCNWMAFDYMKRYNQAMEERELYFSADYYVKRDVAIKILEEHVSSYNGFDSNILYRLPENSKIMIAREGSVCIYVEGDHSHVDLNANKITCMFNTTRFGWD